MPAVGIALSLGVAVSCLAQSCPVGGAAPPISPEAARRIDPERMTAQDRAADAVKRRDPRWSGAAWRPQPSPYLQAGQDLTHSQRAALAAACRKASGAWVDVTRIRVTAGGPAARATCQLLDGAAVTVQLDAFGGSYRIGQEPASP